MENKTKILIGCFLGVAFLCFLVAFLIGNNKTYIVTFDSNGGSTVLSQKVKSGGYVNKPIDPIKSGYDFVEWRLGNEKYDFTKKVTKDITLKAYYEEEKAKHKIELEVEGIKKTIEVKDGANIDLSKIVFEEKTGFEIKWYLNEKEFDIEKEKITSDMVLTGKYVEVKTYTVKFDSDGGSKVEDQIVNENKTVKEPIEPTKEGYVFDNWYLDNKKYDFKESVTKDITLKAKWIEDKNLKKYTVTFNSDGGSYVNSQKVIENKKASVPNNPTRNGYAFVEWQLDGKKYDFSTKITKDITLKAVWKQVIDYVVFFSGNGGVFADGKEIKSQTVVEGGKVSDPGVPVKDGYTFDGWDFDLNTPITGSIRINAKWSVIPTYTVSFNTNGGTTYQSQSVRKGNKATNPGTPVKSGFNFAGWMIGASNFDFNTPITDNITITAKWNEIVYTIKSSAVDQYSPDVTLSVWDGQTEITNYKSINYSDDIQLCSSFNPTVSRNDFANESSFIVVLNDGTRVRATK